MHVGERRAPVGVDGGHVHPRREGVGEGVEESVCGVVDPGYAEDVVDVGDDGETVCGDKVGCCISCEGAVGVDTQALVHACCVAGHEISAWS